MANKLGSIISDQMFRFLKSKDKKGYNCSAYYSRLREYALSGLDDLSKLAALAPEDELGSIFAPQRVDQLVGSLFQRGSKLRGELQFLLAKTLITRSIDVCMGYLDALIGPKMARFVNGRLLETRDILQAILSTEEFMKRGKRKNSS